LTYGSPPKTISAKKRPGPWGDDYQEGRFPKKKSKGEKSLSNSGEEFYSYGKENTHHKKPTMAHRGKNFPHTRGDGIA